MQALHELKRTPPTNVRANKPRGTPSGLASPGDRSRCRSLQKSPEAAAKPIQDSAAGITPPRSSAANGCVWVTKLGDQVVCQIRLAQTSAHVARLCQFRLDPEWQHTSIPKNLVGCLQTYCWDQGCLRLVAEASDVPAWFRDLLNHGGFHLSRERTRAGRTLYGSRWILPGATAHTARCDSL